MDRFSTSRPRGRMPGGGLLRLAYGAIALTLALVIVGGVVRISDSGLGCGPEGSGTEGWPLCGGRVVPLVDTNMIVEYGHRVLAGALAIVIALIALRVWRRHRDDRPLVRVSLAALGLVLFQAALGGLTVEKGLEEPLVAAHLGVAMLQIALLMRIAWLARPAAGGDAEQRRQLRGGAPSAVRILALASTIAVLGTIVAGGYMSASELRGTTKAGIDAHMACGDQFPSCGGEFLPFGRSKEVDIHLTHRAFMYVASALVLALFAAAAWGRRRGTVDAALFRATAVTVAILLAQVTLGAMNVWLGEHEWLIVAHLAVGTLLWCSLVLVSMLSIPLPRRSRADVPRREGDVQAVPA